MVSGTGPSVDRLLNDLLNGREADRSASLRWLDGPGRSADLATLRTLIVEALAKEYYAGKETKEENNDIAWTRSWLLTALTRVAKDDQEANRVIRLHLDPAHEPDRWARYWTLESLFKEKVSDLLDLAKVVSVRDTDELVRRLAVAIRAYCGDDAAHEEIKADKVEWETLRALRVVFLPAMVNRLCELVNGNSMSDSTYDAIIALGNIPPAKPPHTENAARALANYVDKNRRSPFADGMRSKAILGLGNLRVESTEPILVGELTDDNPAIAREAAWALEKIVGTRTATSRVVEATAKDRDRVQLYAMALRWMDRAAVVEELESAMISGTPEHQEPARGLLAEIGGAAAMQKLAGRRAAMDRYVTELAAAEEKVRGLFESSILEARSGFKVATVMDMVVFGLGVALLGASGGLALATSGNLESWAGIGLTGGVGVLGVLYSILIAKPRDKVKETVDHLMLLKVLFLGYIRQLHQADQAYTRRLLEDQTLSAVEVAEFTKMVGDTMDAAIKNLPGTP